MNSDSKCAVGAQVHDKPEDNRKQGNRYKELLPRGQHVHYSAVKDYLGRTTVRPQSRAYGKMLDHIAGKRPKVHTQTWTCSELYAHEAITSQWQSGKSFTICFLHLSAQAYKFPAGQRVSRCMIQMSCNTNLTDVNKQQCSAKVLAISFVVKTWEALLVQRAVHYIYITDCWKCSDGIGFIRGNLTFNASHRKDMMLQQMPNLLLIWQPWACCRSSSSCLWLVNWDVSWFSCGRLSKSNLSTWMAILQRDTDDCNELLHIKVWMDQELFNYSHRS